MMIKLTLFLSIFCFVISCSDENLDELEANQKKWQVNAINNYQFDFQWTCFCIYNPVQITVEQSNISEVRSLLDSTIVSGNNGTNYYKINDLFNWLKIQYQKDPHSSQVTYHPTLGYPVSAYFDYVSNIADDELGIRIDTLIIQ